MLAGKANLVREQGGGLSSIYIVSCRLGLPTHWPKDMCEPLLQPCAQPELSPSALPVFSAQVWHGAYGEPAHAFQGF